MYLACIEIKASTQPRVVQAEFPDFEPARDWAARESSDRRDATGNAAVFETAGPLMALAWEQPAADLDHACGPDFASADSPEASRLIQSN